MANPQWPKPTAFIVQRAMAADHLRWTQEPEALKNIPLYTKEQVERLLRAHGVTPAPASSTADLRAPACLPESMSRDAMLKYYSEYANMVAHEVVGYQRQIRELKAALAAHGVEGRAVPVRMKFGKRDDEGDRAQRAHGVRADALPDRRKLPEREGSTYFRALGWNECLDEITRRNAGVKGPDDETKA